ncbi:MAG: glycine--tRNA ligase subunit beta [Deltaproteobacteria bacterium]|nr:MAG: glycine--tRNA ligase subunit beta [Deltaproteobacteria bacterium]
MPRELLVEVGTEEIPAGFAAAALADLARRVPERLAAARLAHGAVAVYGTPRRLAVSVVDVADRQPDLAERVVGPPVRAAYDADGRPTKAAIGFAAKNGVDVADLERAEVDGRKGEYVVCTRREAGQPALAVLADLIPSLLSDIPWPKQMRWHWRDEAFARPVHWVVAIYGGEVVPFTFRGVASGRMTRGHRFLAPGPIELDGDRDGYLRALRKAFVVADPAVRRDTIRGELRRIEEETGARVRRDDALVDEVCFLVEYPVGVCGQFDAAYLDVPEEVIVSAMRSHQRYFAMETRDGALTNRFATIAGTITRDVDVVRQGNERVLAARLADARFFFEEDRKRSLDEWAERLDGVVFQAKLGTVGAKVRRIARIAATFAPAGSEAAVARAAALCKADLVTHMVGEFPDLQGVMGAHYARLAGEPDAVCAAIREHYLPRGAGDALPQTDAGACLAIADRIDTIAGCFAVGLTPTGSADPYALRRAALGVLSILLDRGWRVGLDALVRAAAAEHEIAVPVDDVLEFLRVRLRGLLVDGRGLPADCVDAALAAGFFDVPDAAARAEAVAGLRNRPDFEPLATAFKRVANILKGEAAAGEPDAEALAEPAERALFDALAAVRDEAARHVAAGDYRAALRELAALKDPVDRFFDEVLVLDEDPAVRANRLALLSAIHSAFARIADFRHLAV